MVYANQVVLSNKLSHDSLKIRFNQICSSWKHNLSISRLGGVLENADLKGAGYGGRCYIYTTNIGDVNDNLFYIYTDDSSNIWEIMISLDGDNTSKHTNTNINAQKVLHYESIVLLYALGLDDKNKAEINAAHTALQDAFKVGESKIKLNKLNRYIFIQTKNKNSPNNILIRFTSTI